MALNDKYFAPPEATQAQIVDLPSGTVVFRMYHDPTRDYGEWWATARELCCDCQLFLGAAGLPLTKGARAARAFSMPQ